MKNMRWALIALVLGLSAAGCSVFQGEDGSVEGRIADYNGIGYYYNFEIYIVDGYDTGIPDEAQWNEYYEIDPDTYAFDAYSYNYYGYYDGYRVTYKVTADKGAFLRDGKDKQFTITLYPSYATETGLKITGNGGVSETKPDGSVVFNNGTITVEARIKKLDKLPEGAVKLDIKE